MTHLRLRLVRFGAIALLAALCVVGWPGGWSTASAGQPPFPTVVPVSLSVGTDGVLSADLSLPDPNGSALRAAMDGNFTPLVDSLPVNASQRASVLAQIAAAENTPIVSSFFGNRDGTVEPGEVTLFGSLLRQEARLVPSSALTGSNLFTLTLNGNAARSVQLTGLTFGGAVGPVSSTGPILVNSSFSYQFNYGSGEQNLSFGYHVPVQVPQLPGLGPEFDIGFTSPAQTSITSTAGLDRANVKNDPLGWGNPSANGVYAPLANSSVSIHFHPAFPLGDVTIGAAVAGAVAVAAFVLLRRRRKSRADAVSPGPEPPAAP